MLDLQQMWDEAWDAECAKRKEQSPSFALADYTVTGRAAAKYGGCSIEGCARKHNARGLCTTHYERWRKHGDPLWSGRPSIAERFKAKVAHADNGCWIWLAGNDGKYGVFYTGGTPKNVKAHRFSYELHIGPIPQGLDLDHLCRTKLCVNPAHLEPVTRSENLRRAVPFNSYPKKSHCPQGHPYSGDNLIVAATGESLCRACRREHSRRYREEARSA